MKNRNRPFVVYWNSIPAPYMVDRFNAIAHRGNLEFEAWFNDPSEHDRSWKINESTWQFPFRYLPTVHLIGRRLHLPTPVLQCKPDVLVSLYAAPVFVIGWSLAKLRGIRTCFRVLCTSDRWFARHPAKEALKRLMFQRVDAIETPGMDGKNYAMRYGSTADRIFLATHAIDLVHFQTRSLMASEKRSSLRQNLGLRGTAYIYVGRLWRGKGLHYLFQAFEHVQKSSDHAVSLLIVGDGDEEGTLRQMTLERGLRNVSFAGFQQKSDLPKYYSAADVFVFPTLGDPYGLVIDEAMACALPIISTSAAGEIHDRVEDGGNGYIVPPENAAALADRMLYLSGKRELRKHMGKESKKKIAGHTPERWAADFERIVETILSINPTKAN
jgi:glycosyltransferase involved in cell wall biosynthesis